ncbi:baculoviral IAP repeat-containing protein 3-like, partial [Physella acuta]|uniref:baculoviral IAP repeat-containing protein 3-like n=1 Tax=Physella acuta TaxID=109671 RepID=UPI0027DCF075
HQHSEIPPQHTKEHNLDFTSCERFGVLTDRPKRPDLAPKAIRLQTFSQWRQDHHIKVNDLVEAGFYYGGYADCGRCFYCGGGLKNWGDQDDLLVEHARWFPKCGFIRQKMGEDFVDTVQELNQLVVEISFNMVVEEMRKKQLHNVIEETTLSRDPAVQAVVDLGYDRQDVIQAAEQCVQTEGNFMLL